MSWTVDVYLNLNQNSVRNKYKIYNERAGVGFTAYFLLMCLHGCNVCHTKRCSCKRRGRKRNSWSRLNSLEPSLRHNVSSLLCQWNINNMFRFSFFSKFYGKLKKLCPSTVSIKSKDELFVKSGDGRPLYHSTLKLYHVTNQVSHGLYRYSDYPTDLEE